MKILEVRYEVRPNETKITELPDGVVHYLNITSKKEAEDASLLYKDIVKLIECDYSKKNLLICYVDPSRYAKIDSYIYSFISTELGINIINLGTKTKETEYVFARYLYFFALKHLTKLSTTAIGHKLNRDHATVLHGIKRIKEMRVYGTAKEKKVIIKLKNEMKLWKK